MVSEKRKNQDDIEDEDNEAGTGLGLETKWR
jgi:hypothetical protein